MEQDLEIFSKKQLKDFRNTKKFKDWCKYFFDNNNSTTYGNKTQAALKAYKLDPKTKYNIASCIGYQNYIKLQKITSAVGAEILEKKGIGIAELMELGLKKVKEGTYKDWEAFMKTLGYFKENEQKVININSFNQNNLSLEESIIQSRRQRNLPT